MIRIPSAVVTLLALAAAGAAAQSNDSTRAAAPTYTEEQAERGTTVFQQQCAACHSTAEFSGPVFFSRWGGSTVFEFYDFVSNQMPFDNPGALQPLEYVAVIAYILKLNGLSPGKDPLPASANALKQFRIASPATPEP